MPRLHVAVAVGALGLAACAGPPAPVLYPLGVDDATVAAGGDRAAAAQLLAQAVAAKGGRDRLMDLRSVHATGAVHIATGAATLDGTFARWFELPDRARLDVTVGAQTVTVVIAGDEVWQRRGDRAAPVDGAAADALVDSLWRDRDALLVHALAPATVVRAVGTETVAGVACDVITIERGDGRVGARVLLDQATHLIARVAPLGDDADDVEDDGDYRVVDGLALAHRIVTAGPTGRTELVVEAVTLDAPIADEVFAP